MKKILILFFCGVAFLGFSTPISQVNSADKMVGYVQSIEIRNDGNVVLVLDKQKGIECYGTGAALSSFSKNYGLFLIKDDNPNKALIVSSLMVKKRDATPVTVIIAGPGKGIINDNWNPWSKDLTIVTAVGF